MGFYPSSNMFLPSRSKGCCLSLTNTHSSTLTHCSRCSLFQSLSIIATPEAGKCCSGDAPQSGWSLTTHWMYFRLCETNGHTESFTQSHHYTFFGWWRHCECARERWVETHNFDGCWFSTYWLFFLNWTFHSLLLFCCNWYKMRHAVTAESHRQLTEKHPTVLWGVVHCTSGFCIELGVEDICWCCLQIDSMTMKGWAESKFAIDLCWNA